MDIFIKDGVIQKETKACTNINKKHYDKEFDSNTPGPYYDPLDHHVHVWKPLNLIKNFKGEQNPNDIIFKQGATPSHGMFCSICHTRLKHVTYNYESKIFLPIENHYKKRSEIEDLSSQFKKIKVYSTISIIKWDRLYDLTVSNEKAKYKRIYDAVIDIRKKQKQIYLNWKKLYFKLNEKPIFYQISGFETIKTTWSQMTPYQRLKYMYPDYKNDASFIINSTTFDEDYVMLKN